MLKMSIYHNREQRTAAIPKVSIGGSIHPVSNLSPVRRVALRRDRRDNASLSICSCRRRNNPDIDAHPGRISVALAPILSLDYSILDA